MGKKLTVKNAMQVMEKILKLDKATRTEILAIFNQELDNLRMEDFFGTEGQLDPRGDGRED